MTNEADDHSTMEDELESYFRLEESDGRYGGGTSHQRIENNEGGGQCVEFSDEEMSIRETLPHHSVTRAEESVEEASTNRKSVFGQRNRAILLDMALKRRKEEEEAQSAAEKKNFMRKKFKDALLEKALRARNQSIEIVGEVTEVVCKSEIGKSMNELKTIGLRTSKSCALTLIEIEQQEKAEEDRKLQIATIRRKFKAQHKTILMTLMQKHKDEKKAELIHLEEEEKKKKRKVMDDNKMLARRAIASLLAVKSDDDAINDHTMRVKRTELKEDSTVSIPDESNKGGSGSGIAVGSGFASVRAHRAHTADTDVSPRR